MITRSEHQSSVLSVSLDSPPDWKTPGRVLIHQVRSGCDALLTLRYEPIDLMLVPSAGPDFELAGLMGRVRALRPKQRWMLVEPRLTAEKEICARTHGAMKLLENPPNRALIESLLAGMTENDPKHNLARRVRRVELKKNES